MSRHETIKMFKLIMRTLFLILDILGFTLSEQGEAFVSISKDYKKFLMEIPYDGKQEI